MNYLTSIRGFAAFLVVLFHIKHYLVEHYIFKPFYPIYANGYLAVDFFFVLSGFIIAYKYQPSFIDSIKSNLFFDFLAKRIARIWPLHVFVLALYMLIQTALHFSGRAAWDGQFEIHRFFIKLFLVDLWTLNPDHWASWNVPSWTISGELFAYICFPVIIYVISKVPSFVKLTLLALSVAGLISLYQFNQCGGIGDCIGRLGLFRCLVGFILGIAAFNIHTSLKGASKSYSIYFALAALLIIGTNTYLGLANYWSIPTIFALALLAIVGATKMLHKALEWRPFVYLGDISYSVYLTHMFVFELMYKLFMENNEIPSIWFVLIYILATLLFSSMTYHLVEVPARSHSYDWMKKATHFAKRIASGRQL